MFRLALNLHPDKFVKNQSKEERATCEEAFKVVNDAFNKIQAEYGLEKPIEEDRIPETKRNVKPPAAHDDAVKAAREQWSDRFHDDLHSGINFENYSENYSETKIRSASPQKSEQRGTHTHSTWSDRQCTPASSGAVEAAKANWGHSFSKVVKSAGKKKKGVRGRTSNISLKDCTNVLHYGATDLFECPVEVGHSFASQLEEEELVEDLVEHLRKEDRMQKLSFAKAEAADHIKVSKVKGNWIHNIRKKRRKA